MPTTADPTSPKSVLNNLGFVSPVPAHGGGTVRTPFVELYIGGRRLSLLDIGTQFDQLTNLVDPTPTKPKLLLIDFNYKIKDGMSAANQVTIQILDPQYDYLMNILSAEDSTRKSFSFRFGWVGIDDQLGRRYPDFFVYDYSIAYSNSFEGTRITIQGTDLGFDLYTKEVSGSFDPATPISKVIEEVIRNASPLLEPDVEAITMPVGEHNNIPQMTPYKYIKHLLMIAKSGLAANSTYTVCIEPALLGKSKVVIRSDGVERETIKKYIFGREKMGTMIDFQVDVNGASYLAAGAGKVFAIAVDPLTKEVILNVSTQGEDTSSDSKKVLRTPIDPSKVYTVPWNNTDELGGFLQGMRQAADKYTVFCRGVVHGDTELVATKQIAVQILRSNVPGKIASIGDDSLLFTSGVYKLKSVEHIIAAGIFRTQFTGYRNSLAVGAEEALRKTAVEISENAVRTSTPPARHAGRGTSSSAISPDL